MKIEKGVPITARRGRPTIYPFANMLIGDSFVANNRSAVFRASTWGKQNGKRFASRKQGDGQYRVWRIA